ncbi:MAG: lnt [Verrucomicrobiaceae bacterium]|nr:lnt [Verrucomicrobiaceae bacterium]
MAAGLLYTGAFAPVALWPMVFIGLGVLLFCLRGLTPYEARRAGFLFGMVVTCLGCLWLKNIFGWMFLVLCAWQSLFWSLFGWGHAIIDRQPWNRWHKALAVACVWTGVEFIRAEHCWLDFPWLTPGHGLGVMPILTLPLLSWIGVYGVGFVVVAVCMVLRPSEERMRRWLGGPVTARGVWRAAGTCIFVAVTAGPLGFVGSAWKGIQNREAEMLNRGLPKITFAAIQHEQGSIDAFIEQTQALATPVDLVIWPEESVPYDVLPPADEWPRLVDLAKQKNCVLVLGTQQRGSGKAWWNTALTLDASGELGRHYKMHPVHLFNDGTPGTEAKPVATRLGKIGTPICFDCDYQDVVRKMTLAGAEFFAVPSMDPIAWGPDQRQMHSELFRIRAAENGRAMVVCATSGVTQVIDGWGYNRSRWVQEGLKRKRVDSVLPALVPGVLTGQISVRTGFTFFTLYGWVFPWLALVAGAGIMGAVLVRGRKSSPAAE